AGPHDRPKRLHLSIAVHSKLRARPIPCRVLLRSCRTGAREMTRAVANYRCRRRSEGHGASESRVTYRSPVEPRLEPPKPRSGWGELDFARGDRLTALKEGPATDVKD